MFLHTQLVDIANECPVSLGGVASAGTGGTLVGGMAPPEPSRCPSLTSGIEASEDYVLLQTASMESLGGQ